MERLLPFKFIVSEWEKKIGVKIANMMREGRYKLRDLIEFLDSNTMKKKLKKEVLDEIQRSKGDNSKGN